MDSTTTLEHGQQGAGRGAPQPLGPLLFRLLSADDLSQPSARYSLEPFAEVEIGRSGLSGEQPRPTALRVGVRDPFASSRHAHLQRRDGGWRVRDEGSRNGTLVNGERAPAGEEVPLADGDLIEIGHTFFLFRASARGVSESGMEPAPEREDPLTLSPEWELELAKAARLSRTTHEVLIEGRTREAEEAFKDGIARLDSMGETARSGDGKLRLARLYLDLGRLDEAEAMARAAVEQHERAHVDSSEAGAALARVLVAAGKIGEARTVAVAAVARAPDELNGQIAAAEVELFEKHPELAIARLNKALAARLPEVPHQFPDGLELNR